MEMCLCVDLCFDHCEQNVFERTTKYNQKHSTVYAACVLFHLPCLGFVHIERLPFILEGGNVALHSEACVCTTLMTFGLNSKRLSNLFCFYAIHSQLFGTNHQKTQLKCLI